MDKLKGVFGNGETVVPREPVSYRPIGVVRNRVRQSTTQGWQDVRSDIILREDLVDAADSLEGFSHVIVVFHMDRVPEEERRLTVKVGNEDEPPQRGVLATRSQVRPNPIGVAVVPIIHRRQGVLRVQGLDALDGTPVLDIKPYLPAYDSIHDATLPIWALSPDVPHV